MTDDAFFGNVRPVSGSAERLNERLEVLLGDRPRQVDDSALRWSDVQALSRRLYPRIRESKSLAADVAITADATWATALALRLGLGVWMVQAMLTGASSVSHAHEWRARLTDGTRDFAATSMSKPAQDPNTVSLHLFAEVRVFEDVTKLSLQAAVDANAVAANPAIKATLPSMSNPGPATTLVAWRLE